jgi:tripeptidyl-peptidase II
MRFHPGMETRHFFQVPPGATWAEMTVHAGSHASPKLFMVHVTQLLPHRRPITFRQSLLMTSEATSKATFNVHGGASMELAIAQFWKTDGGATVNVDVHFHGAAVVNKQVVLQGTDFVAPIMV